MRLFCSAPWSSMVAVAFAAIMCTDSSCSTAFVPGLCFSAPKTGLPGFVRFLRCNLRGAGRIQASASFENSRKEANPPSSSRIMAMEECMQWRFETYGHWREYAANESAALEDAFKKGETSVSLSLASSSKSVSGSGLCGYVVRLHGADAFTQENLLSGHRRRVRRGFAGEFQQPDEELLSSESFAPIAAAALSNGETIMLEGGNFSLRDEVTIDEGRTLTIRGPGRIVGDGHTLFTVRGLRSCLDIESVELVHFASDARQARRELGAAVFVQGKSRARLADCTLRSTQGFGLWLIQRTSADVHGCRFLACGRSAIVAFGHPKLNVVGSNISDAGVHGVCARGWSTVLVDSSSVRGSGQRGIFAYHNASLELRAAEVSGTKDPSRAAVEVHALGPNDRAHLTMDSRCIVEGNAGGDVRVEGAVRCSGDALRFVA